MKSYQTLFTLSILAAALVAPMPFASAAEPLTLLSTTPLPEVTGGDFDHFAVDKAHKRMYVSAEDYGSIEVFSLPDGKHLASHRGILKQPHKILLADVGKSLFAADAGGAAVKVINTGTFDVEKTIPMVPQPDSGIADRKAGLFYVGNGGRRSHEDHAYISIISLKDASVVGRIDVPGSQLKAMVIDKATGRLFVNIREKQEIAVIDLQTRSVSTLWHVPGPSRNSAMAFDAAHHRLFIGSRDPGKMYVLNSDSGALVQTLDIVNTSDEMIYDAAHGRLLIAGDNGVDVVQQHDPDHYEIVQHVETFGGKTGTYIPSLKRFYVVHTKGPAAKEAGLQVFAVN